MELSDDGTPARDHPAPTVLDDWLGELAPLLGLDARIDIAVVLDIARDAAHRVARPAGPLTTFAVGLAVGRRTGAGGPIDPVLAELARQVQTLVTRRAEAGRA